MGTSGGTPQPIKPFKPPKIVDQEPSHKENENSSQENKVSQLIEKENLDELKEIWIKDWKETYLEDEINKGVNEWKKGNLENEMQKLLLKKEIAKRKQLDEILNKFEETKKTLYIKSFPDKELNSFKEKYQQYVKSIDEKKWPIEDVISKIIDLEKISKIFRDKMKVEIEKIKANEDENKMDYLSIMVVGKTGVGKSTLINEILKLEGEERAKTGVVNIQTEKIYQHKSKKVPFLRIFDTRGIEIGDEYNLQKVKYDIKNKIEEEKKGGKPENFIVCIWYCVNGSRMEAGEIDLLKLLREIYGGNSDVPIIIVYTKAINMEEMELMKKYFEGENYPFIPLLAQEVRVDTNFIKKPFGIKELFLTTIQRVTEGVKDQMISILSETITPKIVKILKKENQDKLDTSLQITEDVIKHYDQNTFKEEFLINLLNKYLSHYFPEKIKNMHINSKNEFVSFINEFQEYFSEYEQNIINIIEPKLNNLAIQFLDQQTKVQHELKSEISYNEQKDLDQFQEEIRYEMMKKLSLEAQKIFVQKFNDSICKKISEIYKRKFDEIIDEESTAHDTKKNIQECFKVKFGKLEETIKKYLVNHWNQESAPNASFSSFSRVINP